MAALALTWTSCAVRIQPAPMPLDLPQDFSRSGAEELPAQWWLCFNDPSLNVLMDRAFEGNFNLRSAWNRLEQAEAALRKSGATLYPELNDSAAWKRTWSREKSVQTVTIETGDSSESTQTVQRTVVEEGHIDNASLGFSASYEVDLWGRVRFARNAAKLDAEATLEDVMSAAVSLSANIASLWYQLVAQRIQVRVLEEQLAVNQATLEIITLRFKRGQSSSIDVLQQRQLVETRSGQKTLAEAQLKTLEHSLAILLGQAPGALELPPDSQLQELPPLPETGVPAELVRRRPDVRSDYLRIQAADQRVAAAIADRFPQLSITARYDATNEKWRDLFDNWAAALAANLTAPLFDAGLRKAEVERTRAVADEYVNTYAQTILTALHEVEDALALESKQQEYLESLHRQYELSQQITEQTRDEYLKGSEDYLRVLDVQLSHQDLQSQLVEAQRQLIDYRIDLCRALAGGWELARPEFSVAPRNDLLTWLRSKRDN